MPYSNPAKPALRASTLAEDSGLDDPDVSTTALQALAMLDPARARPLLEDALAGAQGRRAAIWAAIVAMQTGKRPDGRELAPPMPWRALAHLTKADANAIAAFLMSIKK